MNVVVCSMIEAFDHVGHAFHLPGGRSTGPYPYC